MAAFHIRHHLALKLVSIVLAGALWLVVSGEQIVERALRIPLEFTNQPSQLELVGDTPALVDVRVRGSSGALSRIASGELVAVIDLRTARPGRRLFHLTGTDVRAPFGVDVVQVSPGSVAMSFETSSSKLVPVVPGVEGEPQPGFVVGTISADPPTVEVIGPAGAVARLTQAITEPVSVSGASMTVTESVTVGVPDPAVRLRSPQHARVAVVISPAPVDWSVPAVAVRPRTPRPGVQIAPAQVVVHASGPRETMTTSPEAFDATVDVEGLRQGQYLLPVRVVAPARVGVVTIEPAQVKVRVP